MHVMPLAFPPHTKMISELHMKEIRLKIDDFLLKQKSIKCFVCLASLLIFAAMLSLGGEQTKVSG